MTRQAFDVSVGTSVERKIIEVDLGCTGMLRHIYHLGSVAGDYYTFRFPMVVDEAKVLRDMLNDAIEHVESGGHG